MTTTTTTTTTCPSAVGLLSDDEIDEFMPAAARPVALDQLFRAEAEFLDRIRSGQDDNVRVLVARDVNVKAWLRSSTQLILKNVTIEVDILNGATLSDASVGDVFIAKVQSAAHENLIHEIIGQMSEFVCCHPEIVVRKNVQQIEPGRIIRSDIALIPTTTTTTTTTTKTLSSTSDCQRPVLVVEVELGNRTPAVLHNRFEELFNGQPNVNALVSLTFSNRDPSTRRFRAVATIYERDSLGNASIRLMVQFGSARDDDGRLLLLDDFPLDASRIPIRSLDPVPTPDDDDATECPWSNPWIEIPGAVILPDQADRSPSLALNLWNLFVTINDDKRF